MLPTASNVAVALTKAVINEDSSSPDFLQQNLDSVYTFTDPRSYPLSSYSYLIVPRAGTHRPTNFTAAKGKTLSTFINYFLCAGQQEVAALGYSPLPLNLVQGGLLQNSKIPGRDRGTEPDDAGRLRQPDLHQRQAHAADHGPAALAVRQGRRAAELHRRQRQGDHAGRGVGLAVTRHVIAYAGWGADRPRAVSQLGPDRGHRTGG